jgi:hypothetical protein
LIEWLGRGQVVIGLKDIFAKAKTLTFPFWSTGQRLVRVATLALSETRKKRLMHLPGSGWVQLDQLG